jgi:hypothetical protein
MTIHKRFDEIVLVRHPTAGASLKPAVNPSSSLRMTSLFRSPWSAYSPPASPFPTLRALLHYAAHRERDRDFDLGL